VQCHIGATLTPRVIDLTSHFYNLFRTLIVSPRSLNSPYSSWTGYIHKYQRVNPATRLRSSVNVPRFRDLTCLRSSHPRYREFPNPDRITLFINIWPLHSRTLHLIATKRSAVKPATSMTELRPDERLDVCPAALATLDSETRLATLRRRGDMTMSLTLPPRYGRPVIEVRPVFTAASDLRILRLNSEGSEKI